MNVFNIPRWSWQISSQESLKEKKKEIKFTMGKYQEAFNNMVANNAGKYFEL